MKFCIFVLSLIGLCLFGCTDSTSRISEMPEDLSALEFQENQQDNSQSKCSALNKKVCNPYKSLYR